MEIQNRFIKAMEIGLLHEKNGISYFELLDLVQAELNYNFEAYAEATFYSWFIENFDKPTKNHKSVQLDEYDFYRFLLERDSKQVDNISPNSQRLKKQLEENYFVKGNVAKQYLDYVELQESRASAKRSSYLSIISIFVAVAAIFFGLFKKDNLPNPPYDVKVIEDTSFDKQQAEMIMELEEKLQKAEMLIEAYESSMETSKDLQPKPKTNKKENQPTKADKFGG